MKLATGEPELTRNLSATQEVVEISSEAAERFAALLNDQWLPAMLQIYQSKEQSLSSIFNSFNPPSVLSIDVPPIFTRDDVPHLYDVNCTAAGVETVIALDPTDESKIASSIDAACTNLSMADLGHSGSPCGVMNKEYLLLIEESQRLFEAGDPFDTFFEGFVLKSIRGNRGCPEIWHPEDPWKQISSSQRRIQTIIEKIRERENMGVYLVQPFRPPQRVGKSMCRIWRLFGTLNPADGRYKIVGGIWIQRPSTRVSLHLASTISGLLTVKEEEGDTTAQ